MKTKRYLPLTHEMCEQAVLEAFNKKWFRRDYLATVEKYGGVGRAELSRAAQVNDWNVRLEAANGIALEMEQRVEDLLDGEAEDLDLDPVSVFYRIDGISMKRRQLSNCCPLHQCFGHLAVIGLRPLFRAKEDVVRQGHIPVWRSYKLVSYNGYFDWTKSRGITETLGQKKLFKAAKVAVRVYTQRKTMKARIAA